jgi:hypothetical protein
VSPVLREIRNLRQEPGAGRRRWFESDGFELVLWFDAIGQCEGFQVCYDLGRGEHALTWRPAGGFSHNSVDQGDSPYGGAKQTPILVADGMIPWSEIGRLFGERGNGLDAELRELVGTRLAARK